MARIKMGVKGNILYRSLLSLIIWYQLIVVVDVYGVIELVNIGSGNVWVPSVVAWRHQAINWTNVDLSSPMSCTHDISGWYEFKNY